MIAASRPVNKNVSRPIGAVIRAKRGTEPGVHKLLANYQTAYKFRPMIAAGTKESDRVGLPVSFMNSL